MWDGSNIGINMDNNFHIMRTHAITSMKYGMQWVYQTSSVTWQTCCALGMEDEEEHHQQGMMWAFPSMEPHFGASCWFLLIDVVFPTMGWEVQTWLRILRFFQGISFLFFIKLQILLRAVFLQPLSRALRLQYASIFPAQTPAPPYQ